MTRLLIQGAIALTLFLAPLVAGEAATAMHHEPVMQVVTVQVAPGKLEAYRAEVKKLQAVLARTGGGTVRMWLNSFGGPDTGNVIVVVEYANAAAWAEAGPKTQADPEWQKILAGLPAMRTLISTSLLRDISPSPVVAGTPGSGSVLSVTGVQVKPGKLEAYRAEVKKAEAVMERLGLTGRLRMLRSTIGGPTTGNVAIGIEYPDLATYVAEQAKIAGDAEWTKILSGLDDLRTIGGVWLYQEITP